jgi:hypothetical protein
LAFAAIPAFSADPVLRAGAFAMNVNPEHYPISVNGNMADKLATGANDPLHARCLVLDDGKTKLALVVVDSCLIPRPILDEAKKRASEKTGIPTSHMLISATHTHTAPSVTGAFQSEPDERYIKFLTAKIAEGIEKAHANLAPAELGWAVVQEPRPLNNRRWHLKPGTLLTDPFGGTSDKVKMNPSPGDPNLVEPAGPIDPDVSILAVRSPNGRPLALYANYSLHYVGDLPALSADYFGVFSERIGSLLGADDKAPAFMGALSNGTSGDVNNINFRTPAAPNPGAKPGDRCRNVAEMVAQAAKKAHASAAYHKQLTFAVAEEELELRVRKPTAAELDRAKGILEKAGKRVLRGLDEIYARETVLIDQYPDAAKLKLQAMRIGDLGIVAIPCEVFAEVGLAIKKTSPLKPTFTVSLANGYNGYLPTPAQHKLGGYETWRARSSYLEVGASEKITPVVDKLLAKVAPK